MKRPIYFNSTGLLALTITLFSVAGFACNSSDGQDAKEVDGNPIPVKAQTAALTRIPSDISFPGTVISERTVNLSTKIMGTIARLDVEAGDFVQQGQTLVRIKDDNLQAQKAQIEANLEQAKSGLKNTETNYNRIKALHQNGSATQKELDDITTQYQSARAQMKALNSKLREIDDMLAYTVLEAPFDGFVVKKFADEGDLASPGQPLLSFEQKGILKISASVSETSINRFNLTDTVSVRVKAAQPAPIPGIVSSISPASDRNSRKFDVEIRIKPPRRSERIKSGMYAEVQLNESVDNAITVPRRALFKRGQLTGLFTINRDHEALLRWVRVGRENSGRVEILSGLSAGETYVVSSEARLVEGRKIRIQ